MDLTYKFPRPDSDHGKWVVHIPESRPHLDAMSVVLRSQPCAHHLSNSSARSEQNQTSSPLLRLPAEIRIKIWEHTLGGNRIIPPWYVYKSDQGQHQGFPHPKKICLRAEPRENMVAFLSLLRVCRQAYHESRLLPFSCNIWELRWPNSCWGLWNIKGGMSDEQRAAIEWMSFQVEGGGGLLAPVVTAAPQSLRFNWWQLDELKGLKVVVRKAPLHPYDWDAIEKFAADRNCRIVEEEMVQTNGSYGIEGREECMLRMQGLLSWRNERSVVGRGSKLNLY